MLTTIAAIAGLIFGFTAFVIGILNYRRDRPGLIVSLQWDAIVMGNVLGPHIKLGQIYIANNGRRPVYITAAGIELNCDKSDFIIRRTTQGKVKGRKLSEGDPPIVLVVEDNDETLKILEGHAIYWHHIRAFVETSAGRRYLSSKLFNWKRPWWGIGDGKVKLDETVNTWIIECELERHQFEADVMSGKLIAMKKGELAALRQEVSELRRVEGEESQTPDEENSLFDVQVVPGGLKVYSRKKRE